MRKMQAMTTYNRGDVILVPFPFTDLTTRKQRPAVIVSSNQYNQAGQDVIIAAITSGKKVMDTDYALSNWQEAGLLSESIVKTGKIVTLHKALIRKGLGKVSSSDMLGIDKHLAQALELSSSKQV